MPKKILLADDSITIQKVVELTFSDGDYEVSAVNNGAKAIQKLSELRPDIILSDIIMPEKNGYEVCEYVKSHPDFRNIPVVLLTGTFEPFDPDRADKAGCDAVVTKPFESQSLIQKVEELIAQAQTASGPEPEVAAAPEAAAASPWEEEPTAQIEPPPPPPAAEPFAHEADIFSAPAAPAETPFDSGGFSAETRAFPRMSFEELEQMSTPAPEPAAPAPPESAPWEMPAAEERETRAFQKMSFEELEQAPSAPAEPEHVTPEPSMWDAAPQQSAAAGDTTSPFAETPAPEPSPWGAPEASPFAEEPAFGGETRAKTAFEEFQQMTGGPAPVEPEPPPAPEPSPWSEPAPFGEEPAFSGETRAFPKMSFEELQQPPAAAEPPEETTIPWDDTQPSPAPSWTPAEAAPSAAESFATEAAAPFAESLEQQEAPFEPEMTSPVMPAVEEPAWAPSQPEPVAVEPAAARAAAASDLSDEQIDRIARRVVELMSEQVVRNIAWEVIPDMAEMVVKERIRQLESEA